MLRVVKVRDLKPGDQFEFGNILLQVNTVEILDKNRVDLVCDVVLSTAMISNVIGLIIYKNLEVTVVGSAYESVLEKEFLDPPINWGGYWSLIHGISIRKGRKQSVSETESRGPTYF